MEAEIWKDIEGYDGKYQVSNLGRVKSLNYNHTGKIKIMKLQTFKAGYHFIGFRINGKKKSLSIHRLVAKAFIGNPEKKLCVNHKNGIKTDNRLENLEWVTHSENSKHGYSIGLIKPKTTENNFFKKNNPYKGKFGKEHNCSIKINQYDLNGVFIKTWYGIKEAQRKLGFSTKTSSISMCCRGIRKTAYGYKWEYFNK